MSSTKQTKQVKQSTEPVAQIGIADRLSSNPHKLFNQLCDKQLVTYLDKEALLTVRKAYTIAKDAYHGHLRQNGEAFIINTLHASAILAELKLDENSISAAILYDVYERSELGREELTDALSDDVATLVDGITKINRLNFASREQAEAENIRKMLMAMAKDIRVIIIKLAQRLHTMRTVLDLSEDKQRWVSTQTLNIFAPLANRLGLHSWSNELQELCFQQIYPKRFKALVDVIKERDGNRSAKVRKMRADIHKSIKAAGILSEVSGRRKSPYSIYKKMLRKKQTFEQINDLYAFRVIVDNVDDCYRVLGVIHNCYKPIPGRFVDYVAIPKANGYQSLHTVVLGPFGDNIEIQIRTEGMDQVAEAGIAAHWLYKTDGSSKTTGAVNLSRQWLIDLLDPNSHSSNPAEFLEYLKTDLYIDQVYVFTPKGDIKKLPRGATALDFAYAVHTGVGSKSKIAIINSQESMLSTELRNGDHVQIVTDTQSVPKLSWLKIAVTGRARTQIHAYLNSQNSEAAHKIGNKLFKHELDQRGLRIKDIAGVKKQLLDTLNIDSWEELMIEIGRGKRIASLVIKQLLPEEKIPARKTKKRKSAAVVIQGTEGLVVNFSRCCFPVPGDDIVGAVKGGSGLVIHTLNCSNFANMELQADQSVPLQWGENLDQEFSAKLRILVRNQRNMFAKVATIIAEQECNILDVETAESTEEFQPIEIVLKVKDRVHLAQVIRKLRHDSDVQRVQRQNG